MKRKRSNRGASHPFLLFRSVPMHCSDGFRSRRMRVHGARRAEHSGRVRPSLRFSTRSRKSFPDGGFPFSRPRRRAASRAGEHRPRSSLPPAVVNVAWSQPGGTATNAPGHLAVGEDLAHGLDRERRRRLLQAQAADSHPHRLRWQDFHDGRRGLHPRHLGHGRRHGVEGRHHARRQVRFRLPAPIQHEQHGARRFRRRSRGGRRQDLRRDGLRTVLALDAKSGDARSGPKSSTSRSAKRPRPPTDASSSSIRKAKLYLLQRQRRLAALDAKRPARERGGSDEREPRRFRQPRLRALSFRGNRRHRREDRPAEMDRGARERRISTTRRRRPLERRLARSWTARRSSP